MKFKYQAKTKEGELQVGFVEAADREAAAGILTSHDLFVLSVEEAGAVRWYDRVVAFFGRVRRKDLLVFTRQFATLLEVQIPLNQALRILTDQTTSAFLKEALIEVSGDVDAGLSLSQAMARQEGAFPEFYVEMIRAAEVTGNLTQVATFLADYTEKDETLASKASSALIYPAIVLGLFIVVAIIMVAFVFPQLGSVFAQSSVPLPWYTQALLSGGALLTTWWPALLVALVMLAIVVIDYLATDEGRALMDDLKLRLPILRNVYRPTILARFGEAAALLLRGGIPVAQAVEIMGHMVGNIGYREVFHSVAEDVRQGELLSASLAKHGNYFPPLVGQMTAVGESTGKMEEMFGRLGLIYTREADTVAGNLVELIQPILMIGMGILVGLLFASILIPIYRLTANIQ
jgi:type IV pilus assembly protein PilC